jgi:hypothetical protein
MTVPIQTMAVMITCIAFNKNSLALIGEAGKETPCVMSNSRKPGVYS